MYNERIEALIAAALADGVLTEKEKQILFKRAEAEGIDLDEFEMILDARLVELGNKKEEVVRSAPQSNKFGDVRKCPACGTILQTFQTKCSECGHEFVNTTSVQSASKLFDMLQTIELRKSQELSACSMEKNRRLDDLSKRHNSDGSLVKLFGGKDRKDIQDEEREDLIRELDSNAHNIEIKAIEEKANIIKNFPVPNNKEDLLELLAMATSNAYDNDGVIGREEEVWIQKVDQIYQKIIICSKNDRTLLEQGTTMVVSLMKRLPTKYKNFTQIPLDIRDKVKEELEIEKTQKKEAKKAFLISTLKSWKGILFIICAISIPFLLITFFPTRNLYKSIRKQYQEEVLNGLL